MGLWTQKKLVKWEQKGKTNEAFPFCHHWQWKLHVKSDATCFRKWLHLPNSVEETKALVTSGRKERQSAVGSGCV